MSMPGSLQQILVVEDEPSIADAVGFVLRQEGFVVWQAATLGAARAMFHEAVPDFLVLDVGLPDGNGFDFCKEIRRVSQVPVIFLTARQEEIDRVVGLEIGGDDYVTKPFSPRELVARVKAVLRRLPSSRASVERDSVGTAVPEHGRKLEMDSAKALARVAGRPVDLTRSEYLLLSCLASRPGQVFSRRQLLESLWECADATTERAIDAHVKALRRKLSLADSQAGLWIGTRRGFGYYFQEDEA